MKKRAGFILYVTIFFIFIIFGIFSFLSFVAKNSINFVVLEKKIKVRNSDLDNTFSTVLYEFSLIDSYIYNSKISSKEGYIWDTPSGHKLWNFFNTPEKLSIGGFSLNSITPNPNLLIQEGVYSFKMDFLKKITLFDDKRKEFLKVYLYTEPVSLTCNFKKKNPLFLSCDEDDVKFSNFRALGEVLKDDRE